MAVFNCAANKQMGQHLAGGPGEPLMFIVPPAKEVGPTRTQCGRWNVRPGLAPVKAIQGDSGPGVGP